MKRFIAQLDTKVEKSGNIFEILSKENIKVEQYLENIDVYVLRSSNDIRDNKLLRNVFEIKKEFTISEEE